MKLIHKLILGFWTVVLLSSITGYFAINHSKEVLRNAFIEINRSLASKILDGIEREIESKIKIFQVYANDLILQNAVSDANRDFEKLDNIQPYIDKRDKEWLSVTENTVTPAMQGLLNNRLSVELREKIDAYEEIYGYRVFGEVFVTNKYGANVAQTGKTSDYRQDDEEWWQKAKSEYLYVKDVEYDESADVYSLDFGIRINDKNDNFIGVIKVVLNIDSIINFIKEVKPVGVHKNHKSMKFKIINGEGKLIYSTDSDFKFLEDVSYLLHGEHLSPESGHPLVSAEILESRGEGDDEIYIFHAHSRALKDFSGLDWILIVEHARNELFAPAIKLRNKILTVSLSVIIMSMILGFAISTYISNNFRKLRDAAVRIGKGDLDATIDVKSNDEIGQLAKTFQKMTEDLKTTTVARDKMTKEISERKNAEAMLKESEEKYRSIVETSPDMIFIVERKTGKILDVNKSVGKLLGYTRDEIIGTISGDRVISTQRDAYRHEFEKLKSTGRFNGEFDIRKKDGIAITIEGRGAVSGSGDYIIAVGRDITERKKAEKLLQDSEEEFRLSFENSLDAILWADTKTGKIIRCNKAAETLFEKKREEIIGYHQGTLHPPQKSDFYAEMFKKHIAKKGTAIYEAEIITKSGKIKPVRIAASVTSIGGEQIIQGIFHDITVQKLAEEKIQQQLKRFNILRFMDMTITASLDLQVTLDILIIQITTQLGIDAVAVLLMNQQTKTLEYVASKGFRTRALKFTRLKLGDSNAGRSAKEQCIINIPNLKEEPDAFKSSMLFADEDFITYFAVPLIAKGKVQGVLELFHRAPLSAEQDWLEFLENIANQAAIAIDNATLFNEVQHSNIELTRAYDTTIEGWSRAMDLRDKETEGHTRRVTEMTLAIALELGVSHEELLHMKRGALLHDMGKMGVPDSILLKPGPLNDEEWAIMKRHPEYALNMLYPIDYLRPALDIPYCHHEKWDGTGYPRGLKGKEIPLAARIFAIVDVWDALISDRPYRPGWAREKVIEHIRSNAGNHFDPEVVEVFVRMEKHSSGLHHYISVNS